MTEAELLFTEILNCDRLSLYLKQELKLDKDKITFVSSVLKRRFSGEPIQYILERTEFMGLDFKITPDVFIPRPETEIMVETAVKIGHRLLVIGDRLKILDIGTGSGCIATSLAKFLRNAEIDAIDISNEALRIAKENARLNRANINFIQSDLFAYNLTPNTYNLIVCNPPYIPTAEIENLQPEIRYEPHIALDGGSDGLDFYRKIIVQSPRYLKKGGFLIMEIGFGQKEAIKNIFQNTANFEIIEVICDYNNIERIIVAKKDG